VFPVITVRWSEFVTRHAARLGHPRRGLHPCSVFSGRRRIKKSTPVRILPTALSLSMIFLLFLSELPARAQMAVPLEYRTKAYFLAQFPRFIDWPDTAFPSAQAPFLICILGEFSFGHSLAELTRGTLAKGRRIEIRSVHAEQDLRACQILFISQSKRKQYGKVLEVVQGANVLTVGETPDFIDAGGAVGLSFERELLHFDVNLGAADHALLKISSGMLALARRVLNNPEAAKS
jgi:hypothetical protein